MNVLSIQSRVVYGRVGNSAAGFVLQCLGHEAWTLDTVTLSNHPGHPAWRGRSTPPDELRALLAGLEGVGALARCDVLLSGYLGQAATAEVVVEALAALRRHNPGALYACDPVLGERTKGVYVREGVRAAMTERLLPLADLVFPNSFELELLTGGDTSTAKGVLDAARDLRDRQQRPGLIVVTGIERDDGPAGMIEVLALDGTGAWLAATQRLEVPAHGAGDTFAALFLGHYLRQRRAETALARALTAMDAIMRASVASGADELDLVAARGAFDPATPTIAPRRLD